MSTAEPAPDSTHESISIRDDVEIKNEDELDQSDAVSDTSTLMWDHEAFDTFRHRVLDFALTLWDESKASDIEVTRMSGGGYNRIICITRTIPKQQKSLLPVVFKRLWAFVANKIPKWRDEKHQTVRLDYILRIPRFDAARVDRDVAALRYVKKLGSIPVPDIVAFDETENNKLGRFHMVQNRLPGSDLLKTFPTLDHDQKCRVAKELGQVFHTMLSKKCAVAGRLILPHTVWSSEDGRYEHAVEPFFQPEFSTPKQMEPNMAIKDLLIGIFEERHAQEFKEHGSKCKLWTHMDQFIAMTSDLDAEGWFASSDISLCHLDFEPRNILIDTTRAAPQPIISGILDWDSAALAPSFMACRPPLWIWAWADDEDEDERTANDEPPTAEGSVLKNAFEQAAGPEFIRYAYPPAYRLARRLVQFAMDGLSSSQDFREADAMLEEWAEMRKSSVAVDT